MTSLRGRAAPAQQAPAESGLPGGAGDGAVDGATARRAPSTWVRVAVGLVLAAAVVLRFVARSHLWLDEALTVELARLPLSRILAALRHDGSPPLFYVLLHGWMRVFGDSAVAVRALPGLFSVASLPLMWLAGRRLGGREAGWTALLLLASSPFAVHYATEARMYSLVVLLTLAGGLALVEVVERQSRAGTVVLAVSTLLLLLTHYWSIYLLAVAVLLLLPAVRRGDPPGARRALAAIAAGGAGFLAWLPSFWFQLRHTGTPWAGPARLKFFLDLPTEFAGGYREAGQALGLLLTILALLALFGRAVDRRRIELHLRARPEATILLAAAFGSMALALVVSRLAGSAFVTRYAAVALAPVLLLATLGTTVLPDRRLRWGVLASATVLGLVAAAPHTIKERTNAPAVAAALEAQGRDGDVVVYCPDQLGPSVSRLLSGRFVQLTFPFGRPPQLVDWTDYEERARSVRPVDFARTVLARAGPEHDLWLVWSSGHRGLGGRCSTLLDELGWARPRFSRVVKVSTKHFERMGLYRFPAR